MALTEQDQIDLMYVIVGSLNASPGRTVFNSLAASIVNDGATLEELTEAIVAHPLFSDNTIGEYPISQTNMQFANEYFTNVLGARNTLVNGPLWDAVIDLAVSLLNSGTTRAELIYLVVQYLSNPSAPGFDPAFAAAAEALANKVEVALYQAVDLELDIVGSTLGEFRAPIADVDDSQGSVDDAKAALDDIANGTITDTVGVEGGTVSEAAVLGASVGVIAKSAFEEAGTPVTYSLTDDAGGLFSINSSTGVVTVAGGLDAETSTSHTIVVRAVSQGKVATKSFTINVGNVNDNPVSTVVDNDGNANAVSENLAAGVAVGITANATDADVGATVTYSLQDSAGGRFAINSNTGVVTTAQVLNASDAASHSITVLATSSDGSTNTQTFNIEVIDQNVTAQLTAGVDNVNLTIPGQVVIGNHLTYNPGDVITAIDGNSNTLLLGLTPSGPAVLGSATVSGIDTLRVNVNPITATDTVTLLMSNVDDALDRVELAQSLGHSFSILDLQNLPLISLDDISGAVAIDADNQVVTGGSDELDIDVLEFGNSATSTYGRGNVTIDNGIEIINLNDRTQNGFFTTDSSFFAGGFNTFNITGGATGADLTIQDTGADSRAVLQGAPTIVSGASGWTSVAGTGITIDSTSFLGDLVADIGGASSGTVSTGVGADDLISFVGVSGTVSTGAGGDKVLLTNGAGLSGSISGEGGNDGLRVEGGVGIGGLIDGGDGLDDIDVLNGVAGTVLGGADADDIDVFGGVSGNVQGEGGNDNIDIWDGITGTVGGGEGNDLIDQNTDGTAGRVTGTMSGGDGNDVITNQGRLGNNAALGNVGTINGDDGNDVITQSDDMEEGSAINGGEGDDVITVNGGASNLIQGDLNDGGTNLQSAAQINGDAGDDTININAILDGDVNGGDGNDTVTISENHREGSVNLGLGDDTLIYLNEADFLGDAESGPYSGTENDGSVDGGDGIDTVTLRTFEQGTSHTIEIVSDLTDPVADGIIDGTDFTSIEILNIEAIDIDTVGDVESNQFFNVDLRAFDLALTTINILERDDSATVDLDGYNSEVINVDSDGDAGTDVFLNISQGTYNGGGFWLGGALTGLRPGANTLNLNLNGNFAYETDVDDALGIRHTVLGFNGTGNRSLILDGSDQDNNGVAAGEGNTLTVSGDNTGRLTVFGAYQETVDASAIAGSLYLEIVDDGEANEALTITTAGGDDWIDIVGDTLGLTDSIHMGGGFNRLVVDSSTRTLSLVDEDQVFENISGMSVIRFVGDDGGTLNVSIEDDFRSAGDGTATQQIEVMNNGGTAGNVDIDIDADYLDDHPDPSNALLVFDVRSGFVDIDNGADVDLDVNLYAEGSASLFGQSSTTGVAGSGVMFTNTGNGDVDINITIANSAPTVVASQFLNDNNAADPSVVGNVAIDVLSGEISPDTMTFFDVGSDTSNILVTWDDAWNNGDFFRVDASNIVNDDFVDAGTPNFHTGGLTFNGWVEDDARFNLTGTGNSDTIRGSQNSDFIETGDGHDVVVADPADGQVIAPGTQSVTDVTLPASPPEVVEAGDSYSITIGGATFTWTAPADATPIQDAVDGLIAAINAGSSLGDVTLTGNIDDGDNTDDVAASDLGGGVIRITGTGEDPVLGYALGEEFNITAASQNKPVAVVTIISEPYDENDVVTVTVDGTDYDATVGLLSTNDTLAATIIAAINADGAATVTASAGTNAGEILLHPKTPGDKYAISAAWSVDQMDIPASAKVVTVTYTDLEGGETASVSFTGGITVAAGTIAALAAAINAHGILGPQWNAVDSGGGVLTLTADAVGATPPANDVSTADIAGGDGGSVGIVSVDGTDFQDFNDQTAPTVAAEQVCFDLSDPLYDGGDSIDVTIDGTTYSAVLPGVSGEDDVDHDGATAAAAVAAALNGNGAFTGAGFSASADGSVVSITGTDANSTWSVAITDVLPNGIQEEIIDLDYTGFVAGPNAEVTVTIGAVTYTAATVAALEALVDADTGTHGYDASVAGDVLTLTGTLGGAEPTDSLDAGIVSGQFTNDGGAVVTDQNVAPTLLVPASQVLDFDDSPIDDEDGASVSFGGLTINVPDSGSVAQTLAALAAAIEAQTGWNATVTGAAQITITSDDDNPAAEGYATAVNTLDDIDDLVYSAPVPGSAAVPTTWTVTAVTFDDAPGGNSISVTFDTNLDGADSLGDFSVSANTWAELAANINASLGTLGPGITGAAVGGGGIIISGLASGIDNVATVDIIPVSADGANGTIGASVSAPTAATAPVEWSQTIELPAALGAGDVVFIELSDGSLVEVTLPGGADPANATAVAAALEAKFDADSGVDIAATVDVDNVTVILTTVSVDPNNPVDPSFSIANVSPDGNEPYTPSAEGLNAGVGGSPAVPALIELDFTVNGDDGETLQITLAAGNIYQGTGATIALAALDLAANINADTGVHGWVADGSVAADFTLTGPANGTLPGINFVSAELLQVTDAIATEIQESWMNYDNTDPTLAFEGGQPNTDPGVVEVVDAVPAPVAPVSSGGNDTVNGGEGNDSIWGMDGNDLLNGDGGNDYLSGGNGSDVINGGAGNDLVDGDAGNDNIDGGSGNDVLRGGNGADTILGGEGDDSLFGYDLAGDDGSNDVLIGGAGSDTIDGGLGRDTMQGGSGGADGAVDVFVFRPGDSTGAVGQSDLVQFFEGGVGGDIINLDLTTAGTFMGTFGDTTNVLAALNSGGGPVAGRTVYDFNAKLLYVDVIGSGNINNAMTVNIEVIGGGENFTAANVMFS